MLGSLADADDLAQETISKALAAADTFERRADIKTWLFRIATHACIDELRSARRRKLVSTTAASKPDDDEPRNGDVEDWITPFPDALLPEQRLAHAQTVTLAFVAAVQWLPARQRAVLILRDVLEWSAEEVGELLGMTTTAVHSALIRARDKIKERSRVRGVAKPAAGRSELAVARRFATAYAANDVEALIALLREDVEVHMPPIDLWLAGRDQFTAFLVRRMWPMGRFTMDTTRANGRPACVVQLNGAPYAVVSFELTQRGLIQRIHAFLIPPLAAHFAS